MDRLTKEFSEVFASLDANYMALLRNPLVQQGRGVDRSHVDEFTALLSRCVPVTAAEKSFAASMRFLAQKSRSSFIKAMFEGRYACVCLLIDGRMIEIGLKVEHLFSINYDADGTVHIGPPRPPPDQRGSRRRGRKGHGRTIADASGSASGVATGIVSSDLDSTDDDADGFLRVDHRGRGHQVGRPVLDDAARKQLISELNAASSELDAASSEPTGDSFAGNGTTNETTEIAPEPQKAPVVAPKKKATYLDVAGRATLNAGKDLASETGANSPPSSSSSMGGSASNSGISTPALWADLVEEELLARAAAEEAAAKAAAKAAVEATTACDKKSPAKKPGK